MRFFSPLFFKVVQRNFDVFLRLWHSEVPGTVVEPLLILLSIGIGLGAYVGLVNGQTYIQFVAPGIIAGYSMFSSVFECTYSSFIRMDYQKTYDAIISTPVTVEDVTAGEIFWGAFRGFLIGAVMLLLAWAFGLVHSPWAILVLPLCYLEGLLFSSIALFYTSLVPHVYSFNYFFSLFVTPMFYFSGVFFPLSSFPVIIQKLSWIAPLTPVVNLMREAITGKFVLNTLLLSLALVIGLTVIFFMLTLLTMRRRLTK